MGHDKDKMISGLICGDDLSKVKEAVCVQVEKVYDSCKEKDCIENATVLFKCPHKIKKLIDNAINVKCRRAEVVDVFADIEPVPFKRGFYTVDVKFFIKVTLDFFIPRRSFETNIVTKTGLVLFDKKVILFGSEGNVKIFKSHFVEHGIDTPIHSKLQQDNQPISKVEVAEPIALNARIEEIHEKCCGDRSITEQLPERICKLIGDDDEDEDECDADEYETCEEEHECNHNPRKKVVVSLGLFSIVKLVRLVQLLIPAFDFCVPNS